VVIFYSATTTFTITTNHSQTFTNLTASSAESSKIGQGFYLCNATAGQTTVTATVTTGVIVYNMLIFELAGPPSSGCLDTSATAVGAATTTPSGGSVTPSQAGDLIVATFLKAGTPLCTALPCYTAGTGQSGITWNLRGVDYQNGGAQQWGIYSLTSALNPTITDISSTYIGVTMAFKAANGGTTPTGMYPIYDTACNTPVTATSTQKCQAPTSGNLTTTSANGAGPYITSVAGVNTWKTAGGPSWTDIDGPGVFTFYTGSSMAYAPNATPDGSGQLTYTLNISSDADVTLHIVDWAGAATSPFVNRQQIGGYSSTAISTLSYLSAFYPGMTDGWVISDANWANSTASGCGSPSGCILLSGTWGGQQGNGPSYPDQNGFWSTFHNSSAASQTTEVLFNQSDNLDGWSGETASFLSATGSLSGPSFVQTPFNQATSGSTVAITATATLAGSYYAVAIGSQSGSITVTKVCTDGGTCAGGNSFTKQVSATASSIGADTEIWNLSGHASGVTTVTVTMSGTITAVEAKLYEIRNVSGVDVSGGVTAGTGAANLYTGASVTPTASPSICVSMTSISSATGITANPYDGNVWGYDNTNYSGTGDASGALIAGSGTYSYVTAAGAAADAFTNATECLK
jgi:hypothetical protein